MRWEKKFARNLNRSSVTQPVLFREIKESDPVREKYPLLFLTARAPGHSDLPKKIFLDLVEANRQQLIAVGIPKKSIDCLSPVYELSSRTAVLVSSSEREDREADGSRRHPQVKFTLW